MRLSFNPRLDHHPRVTSPCAQRQSKKLTQSREGRKDIIGRNRFQHGGCVVRMPFLYSIYFSALDVIYTS
ncbi:hypothetical protein [Symmachiella dynata]|uniref:hypothetical protein n=1 Tax=Symmachiella dynata TaxID=2527995 RepID=UPI00119CE934|nr:hypothetical protein [Symmachiella dynata]